MHVVLAAITAVAGLLWALSSLQRSGFDLNSLNPFSAYRRWQWRKAHGGKPLYKLDSTMDVAAVLLVGVVKATGEMSAQQKHALMNTFQREFEITRDQAADLLVAGSHLLRDQIYVVDDLQKVLSRTQDKFTPEQVASLLRMMRALAVQDAAMNHEQRKLIDATEQFFAQRAAGVRRWA